MFLSIIFLVVGLALILWGANAMTDGSSDLARRMGVSDLIIGLTVVAFGTSAPELVISLVSAFQGAPSMAIGNIVGSNIFNVLVIIGVTAMVKPIEVERSILNNEIPLVIVASLALAAIGLSSYMGAGAPEVTRVDGILLLLFFAIFMRYIFAQATQDKTPEGAAPTKEAAKAPTPQMSLLKAVIFVVGGLAALIIGGDRFVAGASGIASALGVSQAVIGLTIVAAGTSLPELATSIVAATKGRQGLAVGNVIGSNIFNIFMVLGLTGTISPLPFNDIGAVDLMVMVGSALLFWCVGWLWGNRVIKRAEGALMLLCYIAYTLWLISQA